jgi:hypothetical protein
MLPKVCLEKVDLIKLDLEGHEPKALAGSSRILTTSKPAILIKVITEATGIEVQEILVAYGYKYYLIDETLGLLKSDSLMPPNG